MVFIVCLFSFVFVGLIFNCWFVLLGICCAVSVDCYDRQVVFVFCLCFWLLWVCVVLLWLDFCAY